jgi:DNA-binding transcriptional LysR family regulator
MLNVGRLQVLVAVVERGSISGAADALSYTQSAVSQSIARLETETGVALLHRGRRGVTPTEAGTVLAGHAERILAAIGTAEAALSELSGAQRTRLRVGTFPSGGAALMPLAVARLRRVHPDVALTLAEGEPAQIAPRLRAGELDVALLYEFPAPAVRRDERAGLRTTVLLNDPMDLILPVGHRLGTRATVTLADLRREPWVQTAAASPCARHVVRCCQAAGFTPDVAFESDDYTTVQGLVAAGVGVALVPRLALGPGHPGVVVRRLTPASPIRRITVATAAGRLAPPAAVRTMIAELTEVARRRAELSEPVDAADNAHSAEFPAPAAG